MRLGWARFLLTAIVLEIHSEWIGTLKPQSTCSKRVSMDRRYQPPILANVTFARTKKLPVSRVRLFRRGTTRLLSASGSRTMASSFSRSGPEGSSFVDDTAQALPVEYTLAFPIK